MKKIVFRVDSGNHIGIGHVSRCLTLARKLKASGYEISFITKNHLGYAHEFISQEFFLMVIEGGLIQSLDANEKNNYQSWLGSTPEEDLFLTNQCLEKIADVDLVIVDHYSLAAEYESQLKAKKVMVIDDLYNRNHHCQLLLNQNIGALQKSYDHLLTSSNTKTLMGPKFALLRDEFKTLRKQVNPQLFNRPIKKCLVFFGGKDVESDTLKILKSLPFDLYQQYQFHFILDSQHRDYTEVQNIWKNNSQFKLSHLSSDFAQLMMDTDLFIGAGGSTAWERATLGVASAVVCVADNQLDNCLDLQESLNAYYLGKSKDLKAGDWQQFFATKVSETNFWERLRNNSFNLVDGEGTQYVVNEITKLLKGESNWN